ncbi:transposase [Adlercreutzia equolifaciens]|nr:transposase [Adlercreutzia equolifaciens]MCB6975249.1 transposase [Adlercreutzia equolifaciens]
MVEVVARHCPGVECAVDPLYVVQWVTDVLDETRREAWRGCEG